MGESFGPDARGTHFELVELPSLADWPEDLRPACLLLALDARDVPTPELGDLAERLIPAGLAMVDCHGPDCGRVHDIFDETLVGLEVDGLHVAPDTVATNWHHGQPFSEALFCFAEFAAPDGFPPPTLRTAVIIGLPDRTRDARRWLRAWCAMPRDWFGSGSR